MSNPVSHIVIRYCDNYDSSVALLIYVMCLQILCGIQSFRGRNLPGKYNEAKYISFAMFQSTILLILSLLLRKNIQKLEDSLLVQSCLLVFANLSILITLYGYKLLVVLFRPAENTLNVFRKRVGKLQINSDKSLHSRVHWETKSYFMFILFIFRICLFDNIILRLFVFNPLFHEFLRKLWKKYFLLIFSGNTSKKSIFVIENFFCPIETNLRYDSIWSHHGVK